MISKILLILTIAIVVILGTLGFVGNYFYNLSLNPNISKSMVLGESDSEEALATINTNWILDESDYEDKYITSDDGLKLHAYEMKNTKESNVWVITVHGYMGKASSMDSYAENFYNMGYNVLAPDLRAHGESEGDYIGMGWDDRKDIIKWINTIIEQNNNAEIILHGVSMGAATVMMTSGEDLPSNVKSVIEDCGYTSVWDEFSYKLKSLFNLPETPVMQAASVIAKIRAGYWLNDASAESQVAKSKTPTLFIHGDKDDFVPYYMLDEVYDDANVEKEKLVIEGAGHADSAKTNPELYWSTIYKFIKKYV